MQQLNLRNSDEMDFTYERLASNMIRLLYIDPSSSPDDIRFDMRHLERTTAAEEQFVALSYVWGDPKLVTFASINGKRMGIANNLASFLRTLVSKWMGHSWHNPAGVVHENWAKHPFWIDAICICQHDVEEKSEQVQSMARTYNDAWLVASWLGLAKPYMKTAFAVLNSIDGNIIDDKIQKQKSRPEPYEPRYNNHMMYCEPVQRELEAANTEIRELLCNKYFTRAWIVQEMLCARQGFFLAGENLASYASVIVFHGYWHERGGKTSARPAIDRYAVQILRNRREEQTGDFAREHPCFYWTQVLRDFKDHRCSDPRDKIFALSAIPDAYLGHDHRIRTDYSYTKDELYAAAIAHFESLLWHGFERATRRLTGPTRAGYAYSLIMEVIEVLRLQATENQPIDWESLKHRLCSRGDTGEVVIQVSSGGELDCSWFILQDLLHGGPICKQVARPWRSKDECLDAIEAAFQERQRTKGLEDTSGPLSVLEQDESHKDEGWWPMEAAAHAIRDEVADSLDD
ncbi:hypothetical protein CKM354_000981600 [Cercospora kikuchii]|uniref:Heterokaryon incompatibility domain-containing protein n=1 Tax=Cercospora kikuchii TaxID=84275 RepID=A0A9P3CSF2_9PEZI|nr:uncharacterized protein CKM354_000981600 [Cercospora kikuchii]GIZ46702.1 hypothetical protein CKM354_000981600 [Cercospora kikuchii]